MPDIDSGAPPPPDNAAILLILGILTAARRMTGPTICRVMVVGEMRDVLEALAPPDTPPASGLQASAAIARDALHAHCASCRRCARGR